MFAPLPLVIQAQYVGAKPYQSVASLKSYNELEENCRNYVQNRSYDHFSIFRLFLTFLAFSRNLDIRKLQITLKIMKLVELHSENEKKIKVSNIEPKWEIGRNRPHVPILAYLSLLIIID
jgi:hypothetical protein